MPLIDWAVVRTAALAGLVIVLPSAVLATVLSNNDTSPRWAYLFGLLVLFGFMAAGYGAGRVRTDTPMIHGAAAAVACYAVVQVLGVIRRLVNGDGVNPMLWILTALLAATMGVAGALFADWYRRKSLRA